MSPSQLISCAVAVVVAGCTTALLVPAVARYARAGELLDVPGGRKAHARAVPRIGGVAIFAGLVLGSVGALGVSGNELGFAALFVFGTGTALVFLVGIVDDVFGTSAMRKLAVQVLAASLVVVAGWRFEIFALPGGVLELGVFGPVISVLWIVVVTNAINLIDGLDGLAAGIGVIIGLSLLVLLLLLGSGVGAVIVAALVGACCGFLPHNRAPAKIFMGDSGSLVLGYVIASMTAFATLKSPGSVAILVPLLALGIPIIDLVLVVAVRFLERPKGRTFDRVLRIFRADRNHLHHALEAVLERRGAVRAIWLLVALSCGAAALVAISKNNGLGVVLLGLEGLVILGVRTLGFARRAREIAREARRQVKVRTAELEEAQAPLPFRETA